MLEPIDLTRINTIYFNHICHLQRAYWMQLIPESDYSARQRILDWSMQFVCCLLLEASHNSEATMRRAKEHLDACCTDTTAPLRLQERQLSAEERFNRLRQYGEGRLADLDSQGRAPARLQAQFQIFTSTSGEALAKLLADRAFSEPMRARIADGLIIDYHQALHRLFNLAG